jgi:hypothetical protein
VVEQRPFKPKVVGSIPTAPTKTFLNVYKGLSGIHRARFSGVVHKDVPKTQCFFFDFFRALILADSAPCSFFIAAPFTASSILI